jgi:hypothetical protein
MNSNKKYYLVLNQKSRRVQGAFPRDKQGKEAALKYKKKVEKQSGQKCIIK